MQFLQQANLRAVTDNAHLYACPLHVSKHSHSHSVMSMFSLKVMRELTAGLLLVMCARPVAYPGILFAGGSTNSVEDRENVDLGALAP